MFGGGSVGFFFFPSVCLISCGVDCYLIIWVIGVAASVISFPSVSSKAFSDECVVQIGNSKLFLNLLITTPFAAM